MRWSLGVVDVVYLGEPDAVRRSELARDDGFEHVDTMVGVDPATLAVPAGYPTAYPWPVPGRCTTPAPSTRHSTWDESVERWRAAPGALVEPWAGATVASIEQMREFAAAVPGVGFLVDTGHVMSWGEDPLDALALASHVQLRDARVGEAQVLPGEGDVDFRAVLRRLDELDYRGLISVEYFDLPDRGWGLADPRGAAVTLAAHVRALA